VGLLVKRVPVTTIGPPPAQITCGTTPVIVGGATTVSVTAAPLVQLAGAGFVTTTPWSPLVSEPCATVTSIPVQLCATRVVPAIAVQPVAPVTVTSVPSMVTDGFVATVPIVMNPVPVTVTLVSPCASHT